MIYSPQLTNWYSCSNNSSHAYIREAVGYHFVEIYIIFRCCYNSFRGKPLFHFLKKKNSFSIENRMHELLKSNKTEIEKSVAK